MATVKTYLVAACCGLMLLSAVSVHAGLSTNGLSTNGLSTNGLSAKEVQSEGLPFNSLSHSGLGKQ
jgi:hypothetical protein